MKVIIVCLIYISCAAVFLDFGISYGRREADAAHRTAGKALQEMDELKTEVALVQDVCPWFSEVADRAVHGKVRLVEVSK